MLGKEADRGRHGEVRRPCCSNHADRKASRDPTQLSSSFLQGAPRVEELPEGHPSNMRTHRHAYVEEPDGEWPVALAAAQAPATAAQLR